LERPPSFKEQLLEMLASQDRDEGASPADGFAFFGNGQVRLAEAMADLRSILAGPSIQVRCLECPSVAPAHVEKRDVGFLAAMSEWLF
jgi:protease IV